MRRITPSLNESFNNERNFKNIIVKVITAPVAGGGKLILTMSPKRKK